MRKVNLRINRYDVIGQIGQNLMGSFLEHVGRAIYTGIYEPEHPTANADGFREDVLQAVRELEVPIVRYPGGNFVSGYHWTDGIGPKDQRPRRPDLAWKTIETNQVGIDDFARWAEAAGCQVMPAVNMGTGTSQEASDMVEYCNFPCGTSWSDKRRGNGREEPYNFKLWCIGNEMDGDWQIGHLNAHEYGRKAQETIKMMKWMDNTIQVSVVGSSSPDLPTFPEWDRVVLEHTYDYTDYISLHRYYRYNPDAVSSHDFLHSYLDMDRFIQVVTATADYVKALKRSPKTMMLCFDEWNVWHQHVVKDTTHEWAEIRPVFEEMYSVRDALLFSGMMMTLINHADRVKAACLAQLVNVIAPIQTQPGGGVLKHTIYYPYQAGCKYAKGDALVCRVEGEKIPSRYGQADAVYTASTYDEKEKRLTLFLLNSNDVPVSLALELEKFGTLTPERHAVFCGADLDVRNTFEKPNAAVMQELQTADALTQMVEMEGYSFHLLTYISND